MKGTQRVVSKHALILMGRGNTEIAAQIFVYDHMREIRVDLEKSEVKVLMDYDESYHVVYRVTPNENINKDQATKMILDFYNNLLNASMKLSDEEKANIQNQRKAQVEKINELMKNKEAGKDEVTEESDNEEVTEG